MKNKNLVTGLLFFAALPLLVSCNKSEKDTVEGIEGTYFGTLTHLPSLTSSQSGSTGSEKGTARVTVKGKDQIEVHCFNEEIDTTFMLDYYMHNDSVMVCLSGEDFKNMYGHMPGEHHMGRHMMNNSGEEGTDWMHHLNDEHQKGDDHFGGFDMKKGTFTYYMRMMDDNGNYYFKFSGSKEQ